MVSMRDKFKRGELTGFEKLTEFGQVLSQFGLHSETGSESKSWTKIGTDWLRVLDKFCVDLKLHYSLCPHDDVAEYY